jgi:hypothetical protein
MYAYVTGTWEKKVGIKLVNGEKLLKINIVRKRAINYL